MPDKILVVKTNTSLVSNNLKIIQKCSLYIPEETCSDLAAVTSATNDKHFQLEKKQKTSVWNIKFRTIL